MEYNMKTEENIEKNKVLEYQRNLNDDDNRRRLTSQRELRRVEDIIHLKYHFPNMTSVLCIGARDDSEVETFINNGLLADGIDVSNETTLITRRDAGELDITEKYDVVYCSHSLEHIPDPNTVLLKIKTIAQMGIFVILPLVDRDPDIEHPTVFEIMRHNPTSKFNKTNKAWRDFKLFKPYELVYNCYRTGLTEDYEVAAIFKVNNNDWYISR